MRVSSASKNEGKTISVDLKSGQTVAALKQAIKEKTGIPSEQQQLIRHNSSSGDVLKDEETLENGGLEITEVFLAFGELEIRVHNGTEMFASRVNKTDTIATLKKTIKEMFGIPTKKQILRRSNRPKDDNILEDRKTMDCYQQILDGNETVYLFITFTLNVETNEPWVIMKMKDKIKDNAFTVEVEGTDSVEKLKRKIGKAIGTNYAVHLHTVRLNKTSVVALEDNKTMEEYGIKDCQTIFWSLGEFKINVNYGKEMFSVSVKESDTVETLKKRIENIEQFGNIPHKKQILHRPWSGAYEKDSETMGKCRIEKGENVTVSWKKFEISVKYDEEEKPMNVEVKGKDTVKIVKEKIKKIIEEKYDVKLEDGGAKMELYKSEETIFKNDQTMDECDIKKGDFIYGRNIFRREKISEERQSTSSSRPKLDKSKVEKAI
ncbi:hypothetical protein niasHT_025188 [Heterodera trifolii]|uniref:Ubiquitin-like domain-containing protein n=1 Tax=Heterodera trifolii TaxID=157864 RepID=A0ABD2JLD9_9BILA